MTTNATKVVFVGGYGRSGSTLLDRMLGSVPGFCSAGEIRHMWKEGLVEARLCGCGEPFPDCPFWSEVLGRMRAGGVLGAPENILALKGKVDRFFRIPQIAAPSPRRFRRDMDGYISILAALYDAIAAVSGDPVVVDSTKDVSHGWLLSRIDSIDLRIVHLVRDSRAVAYSWQRKKFNPGSGRDMDRYGLIKTGLEWDAINTLTSLLQTTGRPYLRIDYADLVADPRGVMGRLLDFVGEEGRPIPVDENGRVEFGRDHTVAGNPIRFHRGPIQIAADEEWRRGISRGGRAVMGALTWPLLRRYRLTNGGLRERPLV